MKKFASVLLVLAVALLAVACAKTESSADTATVDKPTVVVKVEEYIDSIGEVELDDEELLKQIEKAFSLLDDEQKAMVSNVDVYEDAKEAYEFLKALSETEPDLTKSDEVLELEQEIASITTVSFSNEEKLKEIKKAYDGLSETDQKKVSNYKDYEKAVEDLEDLRERIEFPDGRYSIQIDFDGHNFEKFTGTGTFGIPNDSKFFLTFYDENGNVLTPTDVVLLDEPVGKTIVSDGKTVLYTFSDTGVKSRIAIVADGLIYDGAEIDICE